ncbi:hypothetical protein WMY93_033090 [Mugilogobius chulae]|uniref:Heat shock 70 kDa protein 12A n=1 Tax=Mugilogobius chulae TaxID=88201 RepID=A0AAW0MI13_9GOBI
MKSSCIVAIDFGTAYSGYAYSLTLNESEVLQVKRWEQKSGADTPKTPTCVLFDEDQSFVEFGYKARDRYYHICHNSKDFYYFKDFKMQLYNKRITEDLQLLDVNLRPMNALKVFSAALRFLKKDALDTINKETQDADLTQLTWVLTVPAIWNNPARQFMREAAVQAGLVTEATAHKLVIALEPEAADSSGHRPEHGTQYVVVNCGGGTIDMTVHEVLEGGALKELHKASGSDGGGVKVDRQFRECMRRFFCDGLWDDYERHHPKEAQTFTDDFICFRQADLSRERKLDFYRNSNICWKKRRNRIKFCSVRWKV